MRRCRGFVLICGIFWISQILFTLQPGIPWIWKVAQGLLLFFFFGCVGSSSLLRRRLSLSCCERGLLFVAVRGLLIAVASLVAEQEL